MALDATDLRQWAYDQVDMYPHIWTLNGHAAKAKVVVEFGVRGGVSTWERGRRVVRAFPPVHRHPETTLLPL